ncbi:hypothetical protein BGZ67_001653 [Mortierella alpina]|nr:hypothetical protein BGZ67_001653 [Mortierella alpina]
MDEEYLEHSALLENLRSSIQELETVGQKLQHLSTDKTASQHIQAQCQEDSSKLLHLIRLRKLDLVQHLLLVVEKEAARLSQALRLLPVDISSCLKKSLAYSSGLKPWIIVLRRLAPTKTTV